MSLDSLSNLLDKAVDTLPPLRRVVTKRRFKLSPKYREMVLDELAIKLIDDERAVQLLGVDFCDKLCQGTVTVETAFFEVDRIDNLERLLKIIVEYLPQILTIVLRIFGMFTLFLALIFLSPGNASAQGHWSFPGELSHHLRTTHGIQTAGKSYQEMLYLHDSLHESGTPLRKQQPRRVLRLFRR